MKNQRWIETFTHYPASIDYSGRNQSCIGSDSFSYSEWDCSLSTLAEVTATTTTAAANTENTKELVSKFAVMFAAFNDYNFFLTFTHFSGF